MPYADQNKQAAAQKRSYIRRKGTVYARNKERRAERKKWFIEEVMKGKCCENCGESDPIVLDFHHRDPDTKDGTISTFLNEFRSKEKILAEIAKCDVLCANCHRRLHFILNSI